MKPEETDCPFPALTSPALANVKEVLRNQYGVELSTDASGLVSFSQPLTGAVVRKPAADLTLWGAFRMAATLAAAALEKRRR